MIEFAYWAADANEAALPGIFSDREQRNDDATENATQFQQARRLYAIVSPPKSPLSPPIITRDVRNDTHQYPTSRLWLLPR
jgi:hypothetical protein